MKISALARAVCAGVLTSSMFAASAAAPFQLKLTPLGTYASGRFDQAAAEIVAHDAKTQRLFIVNAASGLIDVSMCATPRGRPSCSTSLLAEP